MGCQCAKKEEINDEEITREKENSKTNPLEQPIISQAKATLADKNNINIQKNIATLNSNNSQKVEDTPNQTLSKISGNTSRTTKAKDYPKDVLELINKIRTNPQSFVSDIEKAIPKLTIMNSKGEDKKIYAGKVKVSVKEGEPAFRKAIEILKVMQPMKPLSFCEEIRVEVPESEEKVKNIKTFQELLKQKKEETNIEIDGFKDSVKDPYTSVLLLVVDDTCKNNGRKRNLILGEKYSKIGVASKKVGKTFCAYFTFAK